ncbi:sigma-70 family RNA polymerase sigma factor [Hyphomonas sp.]|uniref:sigma-70 family RNA polymerase sigma factor n=1 Tax=Hyphomonas sp. TaxID=87 RepID=UPI003918FC86
MPCQEQMAASKLAEKDFIAALEALLPSLRAFARSLCRNAELADDLVQDTCVKALAAKDKFIPGAPMKPWLFRILRNEHAQYARRAWRSVAIDPEDAARALVSQDSLHWKVDAQIVEKALSLLPEKQRAAVIAVLAAGFSYQEAGDHLGCSEGTVKSRVSRGREALMAILNDPHNDFARCSAVAAGDQTMDLPEIASAGRAEAPSAAFPDLQAA